jgi:hypothetical protein
MWGTAAAFIATPGKYMVIVSISCIMYGSTTFSFCADATPFTETFIFLIMLPSWQNARLREFTAATGDSSFC